MMWSMPNVLVSPHMSGDYVGFEIDMMTVFTDNLDRWRRGEELHNIVDRSLGYVPRQGHVHGHSSGLARPIPNRRA